MNYFIKSIVLLIFLNVNLYSQEYYDLKNPEKDFYNKCSECMSTIENKPKEISFGITRDDSDRLYFIISRKEWFDLMFQKNNDGIAIDIINKDLYDCSIEKIKSIFPRGDLQKPIYLKELISNMLPSKYGEAVIYIGNVPEQYKNQDVEFRIVFLKNKYVCYTHITYALERYRWDLLDMGFYFDSLVYKTPYDTALSNNEKYILKNKILKFEIPFELNKSEYSSSDIKPLYDSLNINDFNINKISIRTYSSIEGNEERNYQLQNDRAKSIINALQSYQKLIMDTDITVSENWVDFLNDVSSTQYSYLTELSKNEIKTRLKDKSLESKLEPYLKKHRKAVIILYLSKKNRYEDLSAEELVDMFSKSISEMNLEQAIEIQNSIFEKVWAHKIPTEYIGKMNIPEKVDFSLLLNKNSIFKYLMNESDVYNTLKELKDLEDLIPNDGHLKYNICTMKFKVWLLGNSAINPTEFKKEIIDLKKWKIEDPLIKRMLVNYEILMSEYYMRQGEFENKDKSLKFVHTNYKYSPLSDQDYLSLAQYFASYSNLEWSKKLLGKKVSTIDANEDLLFYYLNLTLVDYNLTKSSIYRSIMLNAVNINKPRFCKIFEAIGKGGVTFQLLENEYLRKTYCENCK